MSGEVMNCVICCTKAELLGRLAEMRLAMLARRFLKEPVSGASCRRRRRCLLAAALPAEERLADDCCEEPLDERRGRRSSCCRCSERGETMPPTLVSELALILPPCEPAPCGTTATDMERRSL